MINKVDDSEFIASKNKLGVGRELCCDNSFVSFGIPLFHLFRSKNGWAIIIWKERYIDYLYHEVKVVNEVLIDYNLGEKICEIYHDNTKNIPVDEWLHPFGIKPSNRNNAGRAFIYHFQNHVDENSFSRKTKQMENKRMSIIIARLFKVIVKDWVLQKKEHTRAFYMIWLFRKDSLPGQLPRDVMRIILKMIS